METFVERSLPLRMRPDLSIEPIHYRTRRCWVVRDPVSLRYLHLTEDELFLLRSLDGKRSIEQVQQAYALRFAPRRLGTTQLQAFLIRLHRQGLVIADRAGQGVQLWERARRQQWTAWRQAAQRLIAIRLPGINPDPWLEKLGGVGRLLFHPVTAAAVGLAVLTVLLALVLRGQLFWARLPTFDDFLRADNLLLLAGSLIGVKVLHELGHALACRHYGRSCPEMGILLLFFMPCLYCDVTSAWTIGNKWRRIVVSAAGMYVELMLASLCFWIWWFTLPGVLNSLSFNTLLVCGVGTLILNGNPLMRYDGYYILADAWEIPNLDSSGRSVWKRRGFSWLLGVRLPSDHLIDARAERWALGYWLLATTYRISIVVGILALFHRILEPHRLEVFVWGLGGLMLATAVGASVTGVSATLRDPAVARRIRRRRFAVGILLLVSLSSLLVGLPLPYRVHAPATWEFAEPHPVYVTVPGRIRDAVMPGVRVAVGTRLIELDHPELRAEVAGLLVEWQRLDARLAALEARRGSDDEAARRIPATREARDDFAQRHRQQQADLDHLTLRAPVAGLVFPAPRQYRPARDNSPQQLGWEGTPLDPINRGAWLKEGTLACLVGDPSRLEAVAVVHQSEMDLLAVGQRVDLFPKAEPGSRLTGRVIEIAQHPLQSVPAPLEATGEVLSPKESAQGEQARTAFRPLVTSYQVRVALDETPSSLRLGGRVHGRFSVSWQSLASRSLRFLRRTFAWG